MAKKRLMTNRQRKAAGLNIANPAGVRADLERRRSSAGSPHDSRPRKARTRSGARKAAISEYR